MTLQSIMNWIQNLKPKDNFIEFILKLNKRFSQINHWIKK